MGNCLGNDSPPAVEDQLKRLYDQYSKHLLPLEQSSLFSSLGDPPYSLADVLAKPMILMMGQCSIEVFRYLKDWEPV